MDDAVLTALMTGKESERVERTISDKNADKIGKAICAFANDISGSGEPGVVFVGVNDDGSCADITIDDKMLNRLSDFRDGRILPPPIISVTDRMLSGCQVAVIEVTPSYAPPARYNGRCWIRVGPSTRLASAAEERKLAEKRRGGDLTFDQCEVRSSSVNDLELSIFEREYLPAAIAPETLAQNDRATEHQMRALRFLSPDGKPNYAAMLCFNNNPHRWVPCAYIQFVRFDGTEIPSPVRSHKEIYGSVLRQIEQVEAVLEANVSEAMDIGGARHVVRPDYPMGALKQYIRNAVMHRDYEYPEPIKVYWFNNRIEIINPGGLYNHRGEDFRKGFAAYRNPVIAEVLRATNFVERFGFGIRLAEAELEKNGNPPPKYDYNVGHGRFLLTLSPPK